MTGEERTRARPRSIGLGAPVAMIVVIVSLAASALLDGASLDDFWTVYLSQSSTGLTKLIGTRWILDIRPPIFDGWATLLDMAGLDSIPIGRLLSNFPAIVVLLLAARAFARRMPDETPFYTIFALLMLSAPAAVHSFGIYRGDFWQLIAFAIQILLARHIMFVQQDYRARRDGMLALFAIPATIAAIMLDYGGALFGGIVAMATMLAAIARGLKRWARSLFIAMALAVTGVVYMISWQAPAWTLHFDQYQNWIEMGASSAGAIIMIGLFGTILHNPVAAAGAYLGRDRWNRIDSGFVILMAVTLAASLVALMQIDAQRRLVTTSNTADISVLVAALMAAAGTKIADHKLWRVALCVVAALSAIVTMTVTGLGGAWQTGAKKIARVVAACPQTQVFAASGWRLEDGSTSRAALREEPVFQFGYTQLAKSYGFPLTIVQSNKPVTVSLGTCPVLLWVEQVPTDRRPKPDKIVQKVGIKGLEGARLSVIRTNTGLILSAQR